MSSFKIVFLTGKIDDRLVSKKVTIRTDMLFENVFAYMLREKYNFDAPTSMTEQEKNTLEIYKKVLDFFGGKWDEEIRKQCAEIEEITVNIVGSLLDKIADELFSEGITWSKITAFLLFVKELSLMCIYKKLPADILNVIFECFYRLVLEKLETWIEDHGNWEGISSTLVGKGNSIVPSKSSCVKSWVKFLLRTAVKFFGIYRSVSNIFNRNTS